MVALDIARVLAKPADEQLGTEIAATSTRDLHSTRRPTSMSSPAAAGPDQVLADGVFASCRIRTSVGRHRASGGFEIDEATRKAINSTKSIKTRRSTP
jgi:ferredoxin--NADP+ reductase